MAQTWQAEMPGLHPFVRGIASLDEAGEVADLGAFPSRRNPRATTETTGAYTQGSAVPAFLGTPEKMGGRADG